MATGSLAEPNINSKTRFTVDKFDLPAQATDDDNVAEFIEMDEVDIESTTNSECGKYGQRVRFHGDEDGNGAEEISTLLNCEDGSIQDSRTAIPIECNSRAISNRTTNLQSQEHSTVAESVAQRQGRLFTKWHQNRLVFKDGTCNVVTKNIVKRKRRYLVDITTFVDMQWRYIILLIGIAFIGRWFFFANIWWLEAVIHGDHRAVNDTDWPSCVANVYDFPTALLFSISTRAIETNCWPAFIILMLQIWCGVFVQSLMTGFIFAKLSRPKGRALTMMFSKLAVICQREHDYCLLFRLGDMRRSHIIVTSIRALLVKYRARQSIPLCQYSLAVKTETDFGDNFVFPVWPITVVHRIVKGSPLWELSQAQLLSERFEIIVIFEGIVESTGMTTQFRTSYLPGEILWGHRLEPLVTYCKTNGQYDIDFKRFHDTRLVESMPECSAREFSEREAQTDEQNQPEIAYPANFTAAECAHAKKQHTPNSTSLMRKIFHKNMAKKGKELSLKPVSVPESCSSASKLLPPPPDYKMVTGDNSECERLLGEKLDSNKKDTSIPNQH